ncbi:MAG: lysylphosphatidylglycerol synthase transmembrane domain-containing protein [bacterium]|nr:lysylphosphatidylglycerol synthase transmembrane domain-containing protein [bacterium]
MLERFNLKKTILSLCITALLVVWLLSVIDIRDITRLFQALSLPALLIGIACYLAAYILRTFRFRVLLSDRTRFRDLFLVTSIHNLAVRILPNPLGEFVFLHQAKDRGVDYARSTAAVVMARVLDFLALALLCGVSLLVVSIARLGQGVFFVLLTLAIALAGIGAVYILASEKYRVLAWFARKLGKDTNASSLSQKIESLQKAFRGVSAGRIYWLAGILSLGVWLSMFASYYFFFLALGLPIAPLAVAVAGGVQVVANSIPNIAGFGVMEAGWAVGFAILGILSPALLGGALGVDLLTLLGTVALGLASLLIKYGREFFRRTPVWNP